MADDFGISQLVEYLTGMGLHLANIDHEQEIIELAFHGNHGQWRMIVGMQQRGEVRKLMLIAPHIGVITKKKRLQCFERSEEHTSELQSRQYLVCRVRLEKKKSGNE